MLNKYSKTKLRNANFKVHPLSVLLIFASFGYYLTYDNKEAYVSSETTKKLSILDSPVLKMAHLKGVVKDDTGKLLSNVRVELFHNHKILQSNITNKYGQYEFLNLELDSYTLDVAEFGYLPYNKRMFLNTNEVLNDIILNQDSLYYHFGSNSTLRYASLVKSSRLTSRQKMGKRVQQGGSGSGSGHAPKQKVVVAPFSYTSTDGDETEVYYPTVENDFVKTVREPVSTFSSDVDYASYTNVRRMINNNEKPKIDAVRVEEFINYFDYAYEEPKDDKDISIKMEEGSCPWQKEHKLVKIGLKTKEIEKTQMYRNNLVFLIDVSGSMSAENKLPWVKYALKTMVKNLNPNDQISIVTYAGYTSLALKSTLCSDSFKINKVIDYLGAFGSTAGGQGIIMAYDEAMSNYIQDGNNRIILVTDGDFNVGITGESELKKLVEEKRKSGVYLTVCGFGMGNLKDSRMEMLADNGNGSYYYIDQLKEAERVFNYGLSSTLMTMAKDVKIQVEFNPKYVQAYRLIGYENRLLNKKDFKDDAKDAGDMGAGQTVTVLYEIVPIGVKMQDTGETSLKYTKTTITLIDSFDEILTLKVRYKKPKESTSIELTEVLKSSNQSYKKLSDDFKLASGVALFGMILRDSKYKGSGDYRLVLELVSVKDNEKVKELKGLVKQMERIR